MKLKHKRLIEHLLQFEHREPITEEHRREYIQHQSEGTPISKDNPLMDCQRWKEWVLTANVEEAFEWWCANAGWAIPLISSITLDGGKIDYTEDGKFKVIHEHARDPIMVKALGKILTGIESVGMMEFYMKHPATNKDEARLLRMLKTKYGEDFEFNEAVATIESK